MNHWTRYLSEAGAITSYAARQEILQGEIREHSKKLNKMKLQFRKKEEEIEGIVKQHWSVADIKTAKEKARKDNYEK